MLTYLINVTGDLLAVSIIIGIIFAFTDTFCSAVGRRIIRIGLAAGFAAALIRAIITNTQRIVGGWKVGAYGYVLSLVFWILLIVVFIIFSRSFFGKTTDEKKKKTAELVITVLVGLLIVSYLYCTLPNVYAYPFKFDTGGEGFLSSAYLLRLGGYLLGIIVCLLSAVSAYKIAVVAARKGSRKLVSAAFFVLITIYAVNFFAKLMLVLTPRKIVNSTALFTFSASSNNNSNEKSKSGNGNLVGWSSLIFVFVN